jgi:hypothetical protein
MWCDVLSGVVRAESRVAAVYWLVRFLMQGVMMAVTYQAREGIPLLPWNTAGLRHSTEGELGGDHWWKGGRGQGDAPVQVDEQLISAAAGAWGCQLCRRRRDPCCWTRTLW